MNNLGTPSSVGYPLRIVLLGENKQSQIELFKLIHESREFKPESKVFLGQKTELLGQWRGTSLSLVRISNIFSMERECVRRWLEERLIQWHSRPNLLLLLVQPSIFTEKNRHRLMFILDLFGKEAFQRSVVVTADGEDPTNMSLNHLLASCRERRLYVVRKDVGELVEKMQRKIKDNNGCLSLNKKSLSEKKNTALNLLLCGSSRRVKTLAIRALSSQKELVSIVELPALFGQSQQIAMKDSLWCVSQFEPQGVHAFILVLPASPLTDEDKQEIETLEKTFGPRLFEFALIVFSVESNPIPADVLNSLRTNKRIRQLCERCEERADVFNLLDRNQILGMMDMLDDLRCSRHSGYTTNTFAHVQIEKILQQESMIRKLQSSKTNSTGEEDSQSPQHLRIVLVGKTGNGKSSSGNTILGKQVFKSLLATKSVTKCCEKVQGEVDGRPVFVVDTPGLFDRSLSNEQIYDELVKCISLLAPGPHVFLLVLPIGKYTPEDEDTLKLIRKWFGKGAEKFTIVLFTKGDTLEQEKLSIKHYIQESDDSFKKWISDCGGRFHVFNNKEKENRTQVSELIKKIDNMVRENGGKSFTNEMLQEAEAAIQKEAQRILKEKEEEMKREQQELERKYKIEIKEMKKRIEEKKTEINRERNLREKQLKVMEDYIHQQEQKNQELEKKAKKEEDMRRAQEERERLAWEEKVKELEAKMKKDIQEKETVKKELEKVRKEENMRRAQEERERQAWEEKKENLEAKMKKNINEKETVEKEMEKVRKEENMRRAQEQKERLAWEEKVEKLEAKMNQDIMEKETVKKELEKMRKEEDMKRAQEQKERLAWEEKVEKLEAKMTKDINEKESVEKELEKVRKTEEMRRAQEQKEFLAWEEKKENLEAKMRKDITEKETVEKELEKMRKAEEMRRAQEEKERLAWEEKVEKFEARMRKEIIEKEIVEKELEKMRKEEEMRRAQEERERLAWKEKTEKLEAKMRKDITEKQSVEKELQKVRAEQMKAQDACERERAEREKENQQRQQEKFNAIHKLNKEYKLEKDKLEREAKEEEERYRQEEENQRKDLEEKHKMSMQQMQEMYEEKARTQAEEFNEFKQKYHLEMKEMQRHIKDQDERFDYMKVGFFKVEELLKKQQAEEILEVVRCVTKTKGNIKKVRELLKRQEKEDPISQTTQQSKHEEEIAEMIQELMNKTESNSNSCSIL